MSLAEIRRSVRPGQVYRVTSDRDPGMGGMTVVVTRLSGDFAFYVRHLLGESKIAWPAARRVSLDADGTLRFSDAIGLVLTLELAAMAAGEEKPSGR